MSQRLTAAQWTDFWRSGSPTTFVGRFGTNYDADIAEFWDEQFNGLASGAHVVDLAAGNGALASLAVSFSKRSGIDYEVHAIDFAEEHPRVVLPPNSEVAKNLHKVDFHTKTQIEQTPFEHSTIDLAISQFGFEYGELEASVRELDRILKPEGRFAAILHSEKSLVVEQAKDSLRQARLCLKSQVAEVARDLVRALEEVRRRGEDPAKNPATERLRTELNKRAGTLEGHKSKFKEHQQISFYIQNSFGPFSGQGKGKPVAEKLQALDMTVLQTQSFIDRMTDLVDVAAAGQKLARIVSALRESGMRIDKNEPFEFEDSLFGHVILATKATKAT